MTNKLLFILLDAFRHDYFNEKLMPFMYELSNNKNYKLESVLGYSEAVKQSLITGTYPNKNGLWAEFIFKSKTLSKWIRCLPLDHFPHSVNVGCRHFISSLFKTELRNIPLPLLAYFDHPLRNLKIPTIYDIFTENKIRFYEYDGPKGKTLHKIISKTDHKYSDAVFIKIPDLDLIGHIYGTHCRKVYTKVTEIDKIVEKIVKYFKNIWKDMFDTIIISDHGMVQVRQYINLERYIKKYFKEKRDFFAFYDATIARFWFKRDLVRNRMTKILNKLNIGLVLDSEALKSYGVHFSDDRYGELIFLLNPGTVIFPNFYSVLPFPPRGMHGYDPEFPGMLGIALLPNHSLERNQIKVVDLFPTILDMLDLPHPKTCQGKSLF